MLGLLKKFSNEVSRSVGVFFVSNWSPFEELNLFLAGIGEPPAKISVEHDLSVRNYWSALSIRAGNSHIQLRLAQNGDGVSLDVHPSTRALKIYQALDKIAGDFKSGNSDASLYFSPMEEKFVFPSHVANPHLFREALHKLVLPQIQEMARLEKIDLAPKPADDVPRMFL